MAMTAVVASALALSTGPLSARWEERYAKVKSELDEVREDEERFGVLAEAAKAAFETGRLGHARQYAKEVLELASLFRDDWNYGNAIHDGNVVLGRIALRERDLEAAKQRLLDAGKTPGSPQLRSFGPNLSLARELLERKEMDVVLVYFGSCMEFWEMGREKLRHWSILVKAGEMPDFGPNTSY